MDEPKIKPRSFDDIMQANPFDDMSVTLDTRYIDIGVGYNKKTGTRISATIDLNSLGRKTEDDIRDSKNRYQEELMKLDLERRRILNDRLAKGEGIPTVNYGPALDIKIEKDPVRQPPVFPTISQPKVEKEAEVVNPNSMGAKAIDEDE